MIMIRAISIVLFFLAIAACEEKHIKEEPFDAFLSKFISEKEFALERTKVPLSSYRYEYGVDENGKDDSAVFETKVGVDTLEQQPTLGTYIKTNSLAYEVTSENNVQVVKVFKPDTDWLIEYRFEKKEGRWIFVSAHDYSL